MNDVITKIVTSLFTQNRVFKMELSKVLVVMILKSSVTQAIRQLLQIAVAL